MSRIIIIFTLWFGFSDPVMSSIVSPHFFNTVDKTVKIMQEEFRSIPNYKGLYEASNLGNIKSLDRIIIKSNGRKQTVYGDILKPYKNKYGYLLVSLRINGVKKTWQVHQIIAITFLGHKPNGNKIVINHINFNKSDNRLSNIELVTHRANLSKREYVGMSKYTGVSIKLDGRKKKWLARICVNYNDIRIGYYYTEIEAHLAYQNKLKELKL